MDEKTKSAMEGIFDKYKKAQKQAKEKQAVVESKEKTFLDAFKNKITDTIRPCLEDFSVVLKEQGHECRVASIDSSENINTAKKAKEPEIIMTVFPNGIDFGRGTDIPKIAFHAIIYEQKVVAHISSTMPGRGGMSGSGGKFSIDEITTETIKQEVLTFLGKVFTNATPPLSHL